MQTKLKLTALAGAVALAGLAGGAQAEIEDPGTGNGELFFSVWDPTRSTSYTRDLGLNLNDVLPASVASQQGLIYSFSADSLLSTFLNDTLLVSGDLDDLIWNIGAGDNQGTGIGFARGIYTGNASATEASIQTMQIKALTSALTGMKNQLSQVNLQPTHNTLADGSNVATVGGAASDDTAYAGAATWGTSAGGLVGINTTGGVGDALNFWFITNPSTSGISKVDATQFMGALGAAVWTFGADGALTFAAPVPEAETWALLGLGLLGVGALTRRRSRATSLA